MKFMKKTICVLLYATAMSSLGFINTPTSAASHGMQIDQSREVTRIISTWQINSRTTGNRTYNERKAYADSIIRPMQLYIEDRTRAGTNDPQYEARLNNSDFQNFIIGCKTGLETWSDFEEASDFPEVGSLRLDPLPALTIAGVAIVTSIEESAVPAPSLRNTTTPPAELHAINAPAVNLRELTDEIFANIGGDNNHITINGRNWEIIGADAIAAYQDPETHRRLNFGAIPNLEIQPDETIYEQVNGHWQIRAVYRAIGDCPALVADGNVIDIDGAARDLHGHRFVDVAPTIRFTLPFTLIYSLPETGARPAPVSTAPLSTAPISTLPATRAAPPPVRDVIPDYVEQRRREEAQQRAAEQRAAEQRAAANDAARVERAREFLDQIPLSRSERNGMQTYTDEQILTFAVRRGFQQ
jgi:hypothetical protein